jgi:hypothetical protein
MKWKGKVNFETIPQHNGTNLVKTDDSRLSDSRTPTGSAGGDLGGTYPNPTVDDGADGAAIHDNVNGEISILTEKASPVSGDWVLIEDSAASNSKKKAQLGNLPGGGGSLFGTQYEYAASDSESSTTNTSPANKLTHTTPSLPAGDYIITWNWELKTSNSAKAALAQVDLDEGTILGEDTSKLDTYDATSGFAKVTLTATTHQIDIDYYTAGGATAYIRRARIQIWRQS